MTAHSSEAGPRRPGRKQLSRWAARFLDWVEQAGNRLPDPLILFVCLAAAIPFISWMVAATGWTMAHPITGQPVAAVNLLERVQVQRMLTQAVTNFTSFAPFGIVLVAMMGIGVAERSGFIATALKLMVLSVHKNAITPALVFAGVMSSMVTDAGYLVVIPLGGILFAGFGRHPIAGICAAFAGVSGGFSANLALTSLDPMLAGFSQSAAQLYDAAYQVTATANYYFMVASTALITLCGWLVTDRVVERRLGKWEGAGAGSDAGLMAVTGAERRGAFLAFGAMAGLLALFALLVVPQGALLRNDSGELKPFYDSLVPLIAIMFLVPGIVYGAVTGSVRNASTVARMTGETMSAMGSYIVLAFAAAQFVAYFNWSNLGLMLALAGAGFLKSAGLAPVFLLLGIVVLTAGVNLFIGSASAKWGLMAPVIVPMMMSLGFSPETAQAAYRVGDSTTNIITPLLPYFPIIIVFAQKYVPGIRIGTLISSMLPYSIAFGIAWGLLLALWYAAGWPLGPGAPLHYSPPQSW